MQSLLTKLMVVQCRNLYITLCFSGSTYRAAVTAVVTVVAAVLAVAAMCSILALSSTLVFCTLYIDEDALAKYACMKIISGFVMTFRI